MRVAPSGISLELSLRVGLVGIAAISLGVLGCEAADSRPLPVDSAPPALRLSAQPFASLSLEVPLPYGEWSGGVQLPVTAWAERSADATSRTYAAVLPEVVPPNAQLFRGASEAGGRPRQVERLHSDHLASSDATDSRDGTWSLGQRRIVELTLSKNAAPPTDHSHALAFPAVSPREASWLFDGGRTLPVEAFVRRQVSVGLTTRSGLLLPAPARVAWNAEVPAAGELSFAPGLLPPDWEHRPLSNGARVSVDVRLAQSGSEPQRLYSEHIREADFPLVRVDLSAFAGQTVEIAIDVDPVGSTLRDYIFIAEPVLAARLAAPRRVVVLFVDTLRPDRLGLYGNPRATSPAIDAWARRGGVFELARSVAPWTLPSARSLFTGRAPEAWDASPTLPGLLGEHGFASALFGANYYLLSNFGMQRDWDLHSVEFNAPASDQTDRALAWLAQHEGRDALVVVHYMDPHLPYMEPPAYRGRFEGGPEPEALRALEGSYSREDVLRAVRGASRAEQQAYASHLLARYDANVRYVDDEVGRLLKGLAPDDLVVLVSDHGEEFFEHGSFEHGHTLGEAVMRIPLVFAGAGIAAGRYAEPVSILDVVPTLLDALALPAQRTDDPREAGRSLWPLLHSGQGTAPGAASRAMGFGRLLHSPSGWGVVLGSEKYVARGGVEHRSQVGAFGIEETGSRSRQIDPAQLEPMRAVLAESLGRDFVWAWRFAVEGVEDWPPNDVQRVFEFDGGIANAWVGADPTLRSSVELERAAPGSKRIAVTWRAGYRGSSEVFVVANGAAPRWIGAPSDEARMLVSGDAIPLAGADGDTRVIHVSRAWLPLPLAEATPLVADDPALRTQLRALGYLVGEDAPIPE